MKHTTFRFTISRVPKVFCMYIRVTHTHTHTHILGLYIRNSSFLMGWIDPFYVLSLPLFNQSKIYSISQELNISIDRQAIKSCRKAKTWKLKCRTYVVDLDLKNILLRLIQNKFWL